MSDDVETAAGRVMTALRASKRLTFLELVPLLGADKDFTAKVLAWLLMRGMISTGREGSTLFVTLCEEDSRIEKAPQAGSEI